MSTLRIFTGQYEQKKILGFSYKKEKIYKAERSEALQYYETEFLKISFPFILFHPGVSDYESSFYEGIGYFWYADEITISKENESFTKTFFMEVKERQEKSGLGEDAIAYFPSGCWGNPHKGAGGWFLSENLNEIMDRVMVITKKEAFSRIYDDLSRNMALTDSGLWLPQNETGFLAPFQL